MKIALTEEPAFNPKPSTDSFVITAHKVLSPTQIITSELTAPLITSLIVPTILFLALVFKSPLARIIEDDLI